MGNIKNNVALKAYAKINLSLYVTGVRDDGYHLIDSVFVPVNIYDRIEVEKAEEISIHSSDDIPLDENNTAYKAAQLFMEKYGTKGARITIKKGIPSMAGLGGGSSDAAAVLIAMNELYGTESVSGELLELGEKVGADVPFFLGSGAARVEGIGEKIKPIDMDIKLWLVLIKPYESLSTANVYMKYNFNLNEERGNSDKLVRALENGDLNGICSNLNNDLERPATLICSEVKESLDFLMENEAMAAGMTGSGSCVFGIFANADMARNAMLNYYGGGTVYLAISKRRTVEIVGND